MHRSCARPCEPCCASPPSHPLSTCPANRSGGASDSGKVSDWEGGVRVNAWVSGGFLPTGARGTKVEGYMHIADWCDETRSVFVESSAVRSFVDQVCDVLRARARGAHRRPSSSRRAASCGLDQHVADDRRDQLYIPAHQAAPHAQHADRGRLQAHCRSVDVPPRGAYRSGWLDWLRLSKRLVWCQWHRWPARRRCDGLHRWLCVQRILWTAPPRADGGDGQVCTTSAPTRRSTTRSVPSSRSACSRCCASSRRRTARCTCRPWCQTTRGAARWRWRRGVHRAFPALKRQPLAGCCSLTTQARKPSLCVALALPILVPHS